MRDRDGRGVRPEVVASLAAASLAAASLAAALLLAAALPSAEQPRLATTPAAAGATRDAFAPLAMDARGRTPTLPRATLVVHGAPANREPSPLGDGTVPTPPQPPPGAGEVAPGARYAWPLLPPPAVRTAFDEPVDPYGRGHRGVDLAGVTGQPVLAAQEGVVVHAGPLAGRGVVSVQHPDGLRTTYEPVTATVAVGAAVARGAVLGTLDAGHGGCPGACLHWGVRRDRLDYVDPLVLLRPQRVRLLPVPDPWPL